MPNYGWGKHQYTNYGCPCKQKCPGRKQGCHSECKEYIEWSAKRNEQIEKVHEKKEKHLLFGHYYNEKKERNK